MSKSRYRILWVDDEIETLLTHIQFLEARNYEVTSVTNGVDAIDLLRREKFDIIFLDERMPGKTGMEFLEDLKKIHVFVPVVMITQSEEESLMNQAIAARISDYLIKPINLHQLLAVLKKHFDKQELIKEKTVRSFPAEFNEFQQRLQFLRSLEDWENFYYDLVMREISMDDVSHELQETLWALKDDANRSFAKFYMDNYLSFIMDSEIIMSHNILAKRFFPLLGQNEKNLLLVIDNVRLDQWLAIKGLMEEYFYIDLEEKYLSIIPTATQYARNALFSGLMPLQIKQKYPLYWVDDEEEISRNKYEPELFEQYLKRFGLTLKHEFVKILNANGARQMFEKANELLKYPLLVVIYNFVDTFSHAKTNVELVKELAIDERAYRATTRSWFEHSLLFKFLQLAGQKGYHVFFTTDHGNIRVKKPVRILADRETNVNIRFKYGRNLKCDERKVYQIKNPEAFYLPKPDVTTSYMFCTSSDYFVYPTRQGEFERYFLNTFQHGGISMEEILVPYVFMKPK
ncbi:MAG: bifunctional response regulator/alkaline phosphatase family protein [Bacteroidales bacterium]|nr:bifunctional response regulator/alkaline phosphatase family protein [Bacteroidales bacterium]